MSETVEVDDRGEMLEVPKTMQRNDLSAWYGDVPEEIRIDRIFRYDDVIRAEMRITEDGQEWVEVGHFREDDFKPGVDTGWVAQRISDVASAAEGAEAIGETIWMRE